MTKCALLTTQYDIRRIKTIIRIESVHIEPITVRHIVERFVQKLCGKYARSHFDAIPIRTEQKILRLLRLHVEFRTFILFVLVLFNCVTVRIQADSLLLGHRRFGTFEKFIAQLQQSVVVEHRFFQFSHSTVSRLIGFVR